MSAGHGHSHGHGHGHPHAMPSNDTAILWAVAVNLALTAAQIIGGLAADSTALIADGVHNLSDAAALVMAFGARRLARRPATPHYSFGWGRAEIVAAFVNYLALIAVSVWLVIEALGRIAEPPAVAGGLVMGLAAFALVVDLATAALVFRAAKDSSNIRAAFLHNLADAGVSVAVLVGGVLIWAFGWYLADPLLTIVISAVILWHVAQEFPPIWRGMMLAAPSDVDPAAVLGALSGMEGVAGAHHLHLWQIDERRRAASLHLVIEGEPALAVRAAKALLLQEFGIDHATVETERPGDCADGVDHDHDHDHDHHHGDHTH